MTLSIVQLPYKDRRMLFKLEWSLKAIMFTLVTSDELPKDFDFVSRLGLSLMRNW